jgi:signal transduction histidine kinase
MIGLPAVTTFRARLTVRWTLAVGTLLAVALAAVYGAVHVYVHRWLDHSVRTIAATEAASSTDGTTDVHLHEGSFAQLDAGAFTEKFVQIFDREGRLVLQSTTLAGSGPVVAPEIVRQALTGQAPLVSTRVQGRSGRVAVLTAARDGRPYAIAVGLFADEVEQGLASLAWLLTAVWLATVAASVGIAYVLASRALAPVAKITERAAWIAQGHFDSRLGPAVVNDEVGRMTVLLNSMLDRLQAALEANRRFASDAAHDLRGPLTAMAGEVDVALRHPRSAERYEETLRHVRGRLSHLTRLAEDLILLVRTQEGSRDIIRREVALRPLVDEAFQRLAGTAAGRRVTLRQEGLDDLILYGEASLISRVIDNVVANAVHYNRPDGWVEVTASVDEPDEHTWESPMVELRVQDTGPGIPAADHERVFERFRRLDHSRSRHTGGSGLGLAISREVTTLHGGTIRVGGSSPAGTTIVIRLPGRRGSLSDLAPEPVPEGTAPGSSVPA